MTIGSIKSGVFPTDEMATASLEGAITEIGKNQKVEVVSISTMEVEGGFIAIATLDISDIEEKEEPVSEHKTEKQERSSADPEASEGYRISDPSRGSYAETAFPTPGNMEDLNVNDIHADTVAEAEAKSGETGETDTETALDDVRSSFEESGNESSSAYEDITVPDEDRREAAYLSEELRQDFGQAQTDDLPLASSIFVNTDAQNQLLEERETEELRKKRHRLEELQQEALAAAEPPALDLTE